MEIIQDGLPVNQGKTVVALGDFDGLHTAHMTIIRNSIAYAKEHGLRCGALLFEENSKGARLITSNKTKLELLERENLDFVYIQKFTENFKNLPPRSFIEWLIKNLDIKAVCIGYDYSFGYKAEGGAKDLQSLGKEYGFDVIVAPAMSLDGEIISSSYIRELIENGEIERANKFLGRSFCIEGKVIRGLQNGRKIGFPTANVDYDPLMTLPKNGVYSGITYVDGRRLKSVINVGTNPTFDGKKITIESHIPDFDEDIYGKYIRVSFAKRLRDDIKFDSIDELVARIRLDIEEAKKKDLQNMED